MFQIIIAIFQIFSINSAPTMKTNYVPIINAPVPQKASAAEVQRQIARLRLKMSDERILRVRRTLTKIDIVI